MRVDPPATRARQPPPVAAPAPVVTSRWGWGWGRQRCHEVEVEPVSSIFHRRVGTASPMTASAPSPTSSSTVALLRRRRWLRGGVGALDLSTPGPDLTSPAVDLAGAGGRCDTPRRM
uniref:Uncharacterized protein n=1 Tax=Leersia perrieri TaxID=77586 RepID=A0A0D9X7V7_9ORYZ